MLKHAGLLTDEENKARECQISGKMCSICHTQNSPTARYCSGCGTGLTDEVAQEAEMIRRFFQDPAMLREVFETVLEEKRYKIG